MLCYVDSWKCTNPSCVVVIMRNPCSRHTRDKKHVLWNLNLKGIAPLNEYINRTHFINTWNTQKITRIKVYRRKHYWIHFNNNKELPIYCLWRHIHTHRNLLRNIFCQFCLFHCFSFVTAFILFGYTRIRYTLTWSLLKINFEVEQCPIRRRFNRVDTHT